MRISPVPLLEVSWTTTGVAFKTVLACAMRGGLGIRRRDLGRDVGAPRTRFSLASRMVPARAPASAAVLSWFRARATTETSRDRAMRPTKTGSKRANMTAAIPRRAPDLGTLLRNPRIVGDSTRTPLRTGKARISPSGHRGKRGNPLTAGWAKEDERVGPAGTFPREHLLPGSTGADFTVVQGRSLLRVAEGRSSHSRF